MKKVWQYAILLSILCVLISFLYPLYAMLLPTANYASVYRKSQMIWVTIAGCAWFVVSLLKLRSLSADDSNDKDNKE